MFKYIRAHVTITEKLFFNYLLFSLCTRKVHISNTLHKNFILQLFYDVMYTNKFLHKLYIN